MRNPRRTIATIILVAVAAWWIGANAYAQPAAPVVARADCDTITVWVGEEIPAPRIPTLYVVTVAVADGERTWELGANDVLTVDREWPGSAWAVWLWGDLLVSGERDLSCEWEWEIVVDTDEPPAAFMPEDMPEVEIPQPMSQPVSGFAPLDEAQETGNPVIFPAGIRWF